MITKNIIKHYHYLSTPVIIKHQLSVFILWSLSLYYRNLLDSFFELIFTNNCRGLCKETRSVLNLMQKLDCQIISFFKQTNTLSALDSGLMSLDAKCPQVRHRGNQDSRVFKKLTTTLWFNAKHLTFT